MLKLQYRYSYRLLRRLQLFEKCFEGGTWSRLAQVRVQKYVLAVSSPWIIVFSYISVSVTFYQLILLGFA
jgi:hypothetical protein